MIPATICVFVTTPCIRPRSPTSNGRLSPPLLSRRPQALRTTWPPLDNQLASGAFPPVMSGFPTRMTPSNLAFVSFANCHRRSPQRYCHQICSFSSVILVDFIRGCLSLHFVVYPLPLYYRGSNMPRPFGTTLSRMRWSSLTISSSARVLHAKCMYSWSVITRVASIGYIELRIPTLKGQRMRFCTVVPPLVSL